MLIDDVRAVYERHNKRSAIFEANEGEEEELSAVRYFPDLPIQEFPWNAVLLTAQQSKQLPRGEDMRKRAKCFPPKLRAEMMAAQMKNI